MNALLLLLALLALLAAGATATDPACQAKLDKIAARGFDRAAMLRNLIAEFDIFNEGYVRVSTLYDAFERLLNEGQRRLAGITPAEIEEACDVAPRDARLYLDEVVANECRCFGDVALVIKARSLLKIAAEHPGWWLH